MAKPQLTLQQQLSRCRTNLYLEKRKNRQLKDLLEEEKQKEKNTQEFINNLIEENTQLQRNLLKLQYLSKEE